MLLVISICMTWLLLAIWLARMQLTWQHWPRPTDAPITVNLCKIVSAKTSINWICNISALTGVGNGSSTYRRKQPLDVTTGTKSENPFLDCMQCDQVMEKTLSNIAQRVAKSFLLESFIIYNSPKNYQTIWNTFVRKFVIKKFKKSPNLVTLTVCNIHRI